MMRWNENQGTAVQACLAEMVGVLRRHGFVLEHEDAEGAFVIARRSESAGADDWLLDAKEATHDH